MCWPLSLKLFRGFFMKCLWYRKHVALFCLVWPDQKKPCDFAMFFSVDKCQKIILTPLSSPEDPHSTFQGCLSSAVRQVRQWSVVERTATTTGSGSCPCFFCVLWTGIMGAREKKSLGQPFSPSATSMLCHFTPRPVGFKWNGISLLFLALRMHGRMKRIRDLQKWKERNWAKDTNTTPKEQQKFETAGKREKRRGKRKRKGVCDND